MSSVAAVFLLRPFAGADGAAVRLGTGAAALASDPPPTATRISSSGVPFSRSSFSNSSLVMLIPAARSSSQRTTSCCGPFLSRYSPILSSSASLPVLMPSSTARCWPRVSATVSGP
ncbi:hypothetical protein F5Y14DRAFT_433317 [Nemania sp. NC0429]|nr:hypothetical protein F5Y14DRAFT_433317 [Nemania sp. NC0429]